MRFYITKINLDSDNRMIRIGLGKNKGIWFGRIDLWSVAYRIKKHTSMTHKEVETMLGREMTNIELMLFTTMKNNGLYKFIKDENGNLRAILKEE